MNRYVDEKSEIGDAWWSYCWDMRGQIDRNKNEALKQLLEDFGFLPIPKEIDIEAYLKMIEEME